MEEEKVSNKKNFRIIKTNLYFILFFILIWGVWHMVKTRIIYPNEKTVDIEVPSIYQNLSVIDSISLIYTNPNTNEETRLKSLPSEYALTDFENIAYSHPEGILLKFKRKLIGKIFYGLYPDEKQQYAQPVYYKYSADIIDGEALIPIKLELSGKYDLANWEEKRKGRLAYRMVNESNYIIYSGNINFTGNGPFEVRPAIELGPFVSNLSDTSAVVWFTTSMDCEAKISLDRMLKDQLSNGTRHVFSFDNLNSDTSYKYLIHLDDFTYEGKITTSPNKKVPNSFSFAFASDSRASLPIGESNIFGHNSYIMKKIAALITHKEAAFLQFTGDMIEGYENDLGGMNLQYNNWFKTLSPFMHSTALNIGFGNHESFLMTDNPRSVNAFPFDKRSGEQIFSMWVENPYNGPISEDGSALDPNIDSIDFPSYKENVYSYTYANVGVIVLNSNYLYTPSADFALEVGGNIHGYIMDNQLAWLKQQLKAFESDSLIHHVFVTIHTPAFPIGGHAKNDMWYYGENKYRPVIAGQHAEKGILEQRDKFLDIIINQNTKVIALLAGDEHNYSRTLISDSMNRYPEDWDKDKLVLNRSITQIVNGSAGAPYYGREHIPWYNDVQKFTPQFAVVFIHINGKEVEIEVINPDTYELIEMVKLN